MIELQKIQKNFGDLVALQDIDLDLPVGGRLVLVGESGSGKSTLLRLLIGLEKPAAGELR